MRIRIVATVALAALAASAHAAELSTSALHPTAVDASGVIAGAFPASKTAYYFTVAVKPGELLTQIAFDGRPGANKSIDFALLNAEGRSAATYWTHGEGVADERTRSFPIDASGTQTFRVELEGPPTAQYRIELGGSALAKASPDAVAASAPSRSLRAPTPVPADGVISGALPGTDKQATFYFVVDVKAGDMLSQITAQSREGADKSLSLELLREDASGGESYWVHGSAPVEEKTRSFPIDKGGKQIIRLVVSGPESGSYKVELGGTAIAQRSPADASAMASQTAR